ncbi:MAG: PAS domain S-box protein, partial [Acidobacteria bacterium]|nr:PAS domain S-box protein [Acidobacteriota bacterium]
MSTACLAGMNVIFLSDDPREAELLKRELAKQVPAIQTEVYPEIQDAASRISAPNSCEAILLDTSIPREEAVNLVAAVRRERKPIGIVALADAADKNPPIDLFKAGVDNFILKRSGYASLLGEALKQAYERHKSDPVHSAHQARIIFAGDIQKIQPHMSNLPHLTVEAATFAPDGLLKLPGISTAKDEVLVIDTPPQDINVLNAIRDVSLRSPDIPIILLLEPENNEIAVQAMQAGAADCIVKTEKYFQRLFPAVEREAKRRELARDRIALLAREERLRQIVESMPVGVTVIAPDGTFLAINRAGLKLVGAGRLDQIVGKNFVQLLPREEREKILGFLKNISHGNSSFLQLDWKGLDGTVSGFELRAVPMRRDASGTNSALAAIFPPPSQTISPEMSGEIRKKFEELKKALLESETRYRELQNKGSIERSRFEELLQQIEARSDAAEKQQAILKEALEEAELRYKKILDDQQAERSAWEQAREALKEQCAKIEGMAQSLRTAQAGMIETHEAERIQWEVKLQELENRRQNAEEQLALLSGSFSSDRSGWDSIRLELEQKAQEAETARAALETSVKEAEAGFARQIEELGAEQVRLNSLRLELEQKIQTADEARLGAEASLRDAEARLIERTEELNAERAQRETVRAEYEQKIREADQARAASEAALREAEAHLTQQVEELNSERTRLQTERLELERKIQIAEKAKIDAESALLDAKARFSQQTEGFDAERAQRDALRAEYEQRIRDAEHARTAAEAALREAETRLARQAEELNSEQTQRNAVRAEYEQKAQYAEELRAALEDSLRNTELRFARQTEELSAERSHLDSLRAEFEQKIQDAEKARTASEAALHEAQARLVQQA